PDHDWSAMTARGTIGATGERRETEEEIAEVKSGASGFSGLLAEPPLIDRITWREGIRPPTLVSGDRGLMARTFGTLYLMAAFVAAASLLLPGAVHDPVLGGIAVCCLLVGSGLFVVYRRTPLWAFQVATALGSVLAALAAYVAGSGADAGF